ncbi:MAG TPA: hypothetical protein VFW30_00820, partial [Bryocella sp.]|nr:hypothetical protein [Bryocella sp.]
MSPYIDPNSAPGYFHAGFKVGWAKHHLRLLDKEIGDFLGSDPKPYTVTFQDDLEAGEYIIKFDLAPAPLTLALMAGDFVACLRGSLDHLASALTLRPGGSPNDRASFPIIPINNSNGRKSFNLALHGVPAAAIEIIRSLQPYHAGDAYVSSKLWRLHRLWNIDKHRRIPLHPAGINLQLTHPAEMPPLSTGADNSGVVRFPLAAKPYIHVKPTMEITINFGDANEGIIVPFKEL